MTRNVLSALDESVLPAGVRARLIPGINGLTMHVLEAGFEAPDRPALLLLHGFPELAFSWRKVMPALAAAGYHVIAPDQRGYGRTTGWDGRYAGDLASFRMLNLVRDALALVAAFGRNSVAAVIGHDFGSTVGGVPQPVAPHEVIRGLLADLSRLPRPRKHYQWYFSGRGAGRDMRNAPQGLHAFLRAYYHCKSADWQANAPHPLKGWSADELAKLPAYYVMDRDQDMPQTVAPAMPGPAAIAACRWLPESELAVYAGEFGRTGFQGGLQWYHCATDPESQRDLLLFSGRTIDIPACFIAGASDWGIHQAPGAFEKMRTRVCTRMLGCHLVEGAGHWVQQEQPEAVSALLLAFLRRASAGARQPAGAP